MSIDHLKKMNKTGMNFRNLIAVSNRSAGKRQQCTLADYYKEVFYDC